MQRKEQKKKLLKKEAKRLLGEASKLTKKAKKLKERAKRLRERAKRLREKASNKISKEDRGFVKYKGEWIKKGSKKEETTKCSKKGNLNIQIKKVMRKTVQHVCLLAS